MLERIIQKVVGLSSSHCSDLTGLRPKISDSMRIVYVNLRKGSKTTPLNILFHHEQKKQVRVLIPCNDLHVNSFPTDCCEKRDRQRITDAFFVGEAVNANV